MKEIYELPENAHNNNTTELHKESNPLNVRDFSKRYSISGRKQLADEIRELRFQYFKKEKGNPERYQSVAEQQEEVEKLEKEKEQIETNILVLEEKVTKQKSRIVSKISDWFRKTELEEDLQIGLETKKIDDIEKDIEERQKTIKEIEGVILDTSSLDESRDALREFYQEQSELKSTFESEAQMRDVESLSKKEGYVFLHGVPTKNRGMKNTAENNPTISTTAMSTKEKLSLLMGLEPTISASIIKEGQEDIESYYTFGVILGGGKVLSAYKEDAGTLAESIFSRKSKYDTQTQKSSIQPDIQKNLNEATGTSMKSSHQGNYNEVVIESPKVAGLYINISQLNQNRDRVSLEEIKEYSQELNLPVYAVKDGRIYPFDVESRLAQKVDIDESFGIDGDSLTLEQVFGRQRILGDGEKLSRAASVIDKKPFTVKNNPDFHMFSVFMRGNHSQFLGRDGYKNLLKTQKFHKMRIDAGLEDTDPGTAESVLKIEREKLIEYRNHIDVSEENKFKIYHKGVMKDALMAIYGFALGAKKGGDETTYRLAENIINEFGSIEEYKNLIDMRVDENGEFKVLDIDVPIEIRKKIGELEDSVS